MINKGLLTSKTEERSTPQDFYEKLNKIFNFTLDPCSTHENHKAPKYFTKEENGLIQDRKNNRVFMNPPYGKTIIDRIKKAHETATDRKTFICMLLPARTDTKRFHTYIYKQPHTKIQFIKGRLKFGSSKNSAPFPSMLVFYNLDLIKGNGDDKKQN